MPALTQQAGTSGNDDKIPAALVSEIQEQWYQTLTQMSTMHDELAQLITQQKDQLEMRLVVLDRKYRMHQAA